jgi:cytidyltransferase-like protein
MKVVLVTGGFDPLHSGHISYLNHADHLGDHLVIGLNSDNWLERKKGRAFMPWKERMIILDNLHMTDDVIAFDDSDGTACDAIRKVKQKYPGSDIVFANGGDRTANNIPEMIFDDVEFIFSVGGDDKQNSSSWILEEWKAPKTERQWGYYRVLHEVPGCKVKELTVDPGKSLSMQRHDYRAEHWMVSEGECIVNSKMPNGYALPPRHLTKHQAFEIPLGEWHQLTNPFDTPCRIVEIQYGTQCVEEDIERES